MAEHNDKTYVTFKWMLMQTLVIVFSIVGFAITIISSINSKIETGLSAKVSIVQFDERTNGLTKADSDIFLLFNQVGKDREITNDRLGLIEQHLAIMAGKPIVRFKEPK